MNSFSNPTEFGQVEVAYSQSFEQRVMDTGFDIIQTETMILQSVFPEVVRNRFASMLTFFGGLFTAALDDNQVVVAVFLELLWPQIDCVDSPTCCLPKAPYDNGLEF